MIAKLSFSFPMDSPTRLGEVYYLPIHLIVAKHILTRYSEEINSELPKQTGKTKKKNLKSAKHSHQNLKGV